MNDRVPAPFGAIAVAVAVMLSATVSSAGQARSAAPAVKNDAEKARWTPPRTPDGRPDLQGVWLIRTATPLERPKALEGRQFLTADEVVELRQRADRIFNTGNSDFAGGDNVFLAALANVEQYKNPNTTHGATEMVEREFDNRTSLIVDPPDGRIPPFTAAAQQRQAATRAAGQRPPTGPEELSTAHRCSPGACRGLAGATVPATLRTTRFCKRPDTSCSSWKPATRHASFPSTAVHICPRAFVNGRGIHAAGGKETRWSSIRRTSLRRATSWGRPTACIWSNGSRALPLTRSTIR